MTQKFRTNIEIACLEDAIGIYRAFMPNLVDIRDIDQISERKKRKLEEVGFLRKEVDLDYYIRLINDPISDIFVAKINTGTVIGFASIYRKISNIVKVRDVIGSLSFENERTRDLLLDEKNEFTYLDQINILPEYKHNGVGTAIFQKILFGLDTPVVAFIVEKPIFNKASIFWHEYNGFEFSAISSGRYKEKEFKFQIFVNWNKK